VAAHDLSMPLGLPNTHPMHPAARLAQRASPVQLVPYPGVRFCWAPFSAPCRPRRFFASGPPRAADAETPCRLLKRMRSTRVGRNALSHRAHRLCTFAPAPLHRCGLPNQSLNRTRHGIRRGPCGRVCHHRPHGPSRMPRRAG
jgi:hypothetical protein